MSVTWTAADAARVLRVPTADDDKYSRGVVGLRTGSDRYPGAAVLGVEAAWRTGIGMVRYLGGDRPASLVLAARPETVCAPGRVQAWVIGSGTDPEERTDAETRALRQILDGPVPVVVDAGALDLAVGAAAPRVVTPHAREHERLRRLLGLREQAQAADDDGRAAHAGETARALGGTVLLKGSRTIVVDERGDAALVPVRTAWLATAGTGDVLAGCVGSIVAATSEHGVSLRDAVATGAWLHARAAELAAAALGPEGGPITATDVAARLPAAVAEVVAGARG
ncbi:ADP-dependent NAD(P)H-hydrate dehydratase [Microbacterium aureliae]